MTRRDELWKRRVAFSVILRVVIGFAVAFYSVLNAITGSVRAALRAGR